MGVLTITFTAPSPAPALGYRVKYREVGTTTYTTVSPNPTSSPVLISVPDGKNWEGLIASICDVGVFSSDQPWTYDDRPSGNLDLSTEQYSTGGDAVTGTCTMMNSSVTRTTAATNDSTTSGRRIKVTVHWTSDGAGGASVDLDYIFEVGSSAANETTTVNLNSGGACSMITGVITALVII